MKTRLMEGMRKMTEVELLDALYRDETTGALNRRAFSTGESDIVALVDVDSLKWVNDNKGHREGDKMLRQLATLLRDEMGDQFVYRISGDEFVIRADTSDAVNEHLRVVRRAFPWFSYGIGETLEDADHGMRYEKGKRVLDGLRAIRGDPPPDVEVVYAGIIGNELDATGSVRKLVGGSKR